MDNIKKIDPRDFKIVNLDEFKVVGFKVICKEDKLEVEMPKLWMVFLERLEEIKNRTDNCVIDISLDVIDKDYTQCICARVDSFDNIPDEMVGLAIPKQKCIYYKHEGPVKEIWMSFYNMMKWAEENGHTLDPSDFKIDINEENNEQVHDLYIRIV